MRGDNGSAAREAPGSGAPFPLAASWHRAEPDATVVDCHWHGEAEFLLVLEGQTLFQIGQERFPVREGEAVFIHPGDIHAGHPLGGNGCRFFSVSFDMNLLASASLDRPQEEFVLPLLEGRRSLPARYTRDEAWSRSVLAELDGLRRELEERRRGYELAVKARLFRILAEIAAENRWMTRRPETDAGEFEPQLLKRVLSHIEQHYARRIYIRELAKMGHMADAQFCRFFKRWLLKTPTEYINGYRIKKAAELLRQSDRKLSDIAREVGFEHPSYFIRRFRAELRCTPAAYRRKHRLAGFANQDPAASKKAVTRRMYSSGYVL
ncbi:MAG TPA: AraC family transcriptional regulator [Paenibacillaceae bacterium]